MIMRASILLYVKIVTCTQLPSQILSNSIVLSVVSRNRVLRIHFDAIARVRERCAFIFARNDVTETSARERSVCYASPSLPCFYFLLLGISVKPRNPYRGRIADGAWARCWILPWQKEETYSKKLPPSAVANYTNDVIAEK